MPTEEQTLPRHLITLEAILRLRGMTNMKFANKAGFHRSDVTGILSGKRAIGPVVFTKIVAALNDVDGARFAEVYFSDMLPIDYPGKVHVTKSGQKSKEVDAPQDIDWALSTLGHAMRTNEHLAKVLINLAKCHSPQ